VSVRQLDGNVSGLIGKEIAHSRISILAFLDFLLPIKLSTIVSQRLGWHLNTDT
jgi:hypothetical protein